MTLEKVLVNIKQYKQNKVSMPLSNNSGREVLNTFIIGSANL